MAAVALLAVPLAASAAPTYVTISLDDGLDTQYEQRDVLERHGVRGTYFVNSGKLGQPGYMTWAQLAALRDEGHEIGGHTTDHRALTSLTPAEAREQVCADRLALLDNGFEPRSFAYPHGAHDVDVAAIVASCGYDSARTTGGLDEPPDCCEYGETLPPPRPHQLRAYMPRLSEPLSRYREVIGWARERDVDSDGEPDGGWIVLVLHDICTGGCEGFDEYSVSVATLDALLTWIGEQPDLRLRTTAHALAIGEDAVAPDVALTAPEADAEAYTETTVRLAAEASDAVGVARVELLVDGEVVGSDATAPYAVDWQAPETPTAVAVSARAVDEAGNVATSLARQLAVVEPPPEPMEPPVEPPPGRPEPSEPPPAGPRASDPPLADPAAVEPSGERGGRGPRRASGTRAPRPRVGVRLRQRTAVGRRPRLVVRVAVRGVEQLRRVRVLVDRRAVRVRRQRSFEVALRPRRGRHALRVVAVDAEGRRHGSRLLRLRVGVERVRVIRVPQRARR